MDYREQAIKDVAEVMGVDTEDVLFYMRPDAASGKLATYAVDQREARLRLYAVLKCFMDDPRFDVSVGGNPNAVEELLREARAALDAGKEG